MNAFREQVLGGRQVEVALLRVKPRPSQPSVPKEPSSLTAVPVAREVSRQVNQRAGDRHPVGEAVNVVQIGRGHQCKLVNLSSSGAMIECQEPLQLWDQVELQLGPSSRVEAVVRWIKGDRYGMEFAHETTLEASDEELSETLRLVIARSFPELQRSADAETEQTSEEASASDRSDEEDGRAKVREERGVRHPLIWTGLIHYNHDTWPVRLRNISVNGALIEASVDLTVGTELLLDLSEAGTVFASVAWSGGNIAGLQFEDAFDLRQLAEARPEVVSQKWVAPTYLREATDESGPWDQRWGRRDLPVLSRDLQ